MILRERSPVPDGKNDEIERPKNEKNGGSSSSAGVVGVCEDSYGCQRGGFQDIRFEDRNRFVEVDDEDDIHNTCHTGSG